MILKPSEKLAYWVGLSQSDGSFKKYNVKRNGRNYQVMRVDLEVKNIELAKEFRDIGRKIFNRGSGVFHLTSGLWKSYIPANGLIDNFIDLDIRFSDPPSPPKWVLESKKFFGAYMAGVIDGDGDVRVKRKRYPQCAIRITNGSEQKDLKCSIQEILNCGVNIRKVHQKRYFAKEDRFIEGTSFSLEFVVSSKNIEFVKKYLLPSIVLEHKKDKIRTYIKKYLN